MKCCLVVLAAALALVAAQDSTELPLATPCVPEACQLPDCRCSGSDIPGGLELGDTPQFVLVTFDDGINTMNIETYRRILNNRTNSNGCKIGATFYVNHEYTSYQLTNELYNQGFEIALHSITHKTPQTAWAESTYEDMVNEFGHQKIQMAHFANIPAEEIKGLRQPFLQLTGNATFQVMADYDITYDCSWPTVTHMNRGLWPYTLDYLSTQDCHVPPCPTASIPGPWILPMISWQDLTGNPCSMVDGCYSVPDLTDADAWFEFILTNFERNYKSNKSPFGFYVHEWYLAAYPAVAEGLIKFLDLVNTLNDVFTVNSGEVIEWVKNPVPVNEYREKACKTFTATNCPAASCPLTAAHNGMTYWMATCNVCPAVYPWIGNPLGIN